MGVFPGDLAQTAVDLAVALIGSLREDDPLRIFLEAPFRQRAAVGFLGHVEERGGMADARGGTHDDRRMVALRQVEGGLHHGETLLGRGRIEHRHLREGPEAARVLLGLGGNGTRIVGHEQHAAAAHPHVVQGHEGVRGHIQPHLLAGEQHPGSAVRRSREHFQGRLLVGRPFHMHIPGRAGSMQLRHGLHQFGRRRAGIARHHVHPSL